MSASAGAAESSNPGRCHARWGFGGSGASSERAGDAEGEGGVGSRVGTVLLIRHPWDVVRSRMMQTGRSLNRPRRASHDGAHNGGTPPPPTKTTTATTSSTTTTRACSGLHFLDIDALCYSSIYVFRRPPAIAHKLLMYERENKKSKEELKEALQKLEAAQVLLDGKEKDAL